MRRFAIAVACVALAGQAAAQSPEQHKPQDYFHELFAAPTGQNALEDFVLAGDLAANSVAWRRYEEAASDATAVTLAMRRAVLSDPGVQAALAAVRRGLRKPVESIHPNMDDETRLPELATFRSVARMLPVEMYVAMADGNVSKALDALRDGLLFGYKVQSDSVIAGLVGIAIDAIAMRTIAEHLDQFSVHDCDKLIGIARDWMSLSDPEYPVLEAERRGEMIVLRKYRSDPGKLIDINLPGASENEKPGLLALKQKLIADPGQSGQAFDEVAQMVNAELDQAEENLKKPVWERSDVKQAPGSPLAAELEKHISIGAMVNRVIDRYSSELASVQMLGAHAAIHRYKWEHNGLPASLEVLGLGRLAIDPFNGRPFAYKLKSESAYELYSVGPPERDPNSPNAGQRVPVYVPFRKPAS